MGWHNLSWQRWQTNGNGSNTFSEECFAFLIVIAITDKWLPSASLMQLLCVWGAFLPIMGLYQQLIISKGKSGVFMWNTIALGVMSLISVWFSNPYGIRTMLIVYVLINIGWFFVWHFWVWREIRLKLWHALLDILSYGLIAAIVMIATHYVMLHVSDIYLRFVGKIVMAAALYLLIMWLSGSVTFKDALLFLKKMKRK